jgi:hypothetical protein
LISEQTATGTVTETETKNYSSKLKVAIIGVSKFQGYKVAKLQRIEVLGLIRVTIFDF